MDRASQINKILFILMLVLALPTGAIILSNQALPGDTFYPVKITLEKAATLLFSPSYQARSDLEIKLIQRRIEENQSLILSSGDTQGLELLVAQAITAKEFIINSKTDQQTKDQSIQKLVNTLKKSQASLEAEKQTLSHNPSNTLHPQPTSNPTISQGNSPISINPTQNPTETIQETQDEIKEIIEQLETDQQTNKEVFDQTPIFTPIPTSMIQEPVTTPHIDNIPQDPSLIPPPSDSDEDNDESTNRNGRDRDNHPNAIQQPEPTPEPTPEPDSDD